MVIDSRWAIRLAREGYPPYCDRVCELADQNALDLRIVHEVGDALYSL